ncbi:MAG: hypothetical protein H0W62_03495 [Chitinophagales bacterium]|nr:hypothetical protein [Chitinophagales bacterium]
MFPAAGLQVNTAARMQQNGEAGQINISGTTHDLVKHRFRSVPRGRIEVKNKGLIEMYLLREKNKTDKRTLAIIDKFYYE